MSTSLQYHPISARRLFVDPSLPNTALLNLQLSHLDDPESGIYEVSISIGNSPDDQSILDQTSLTPGANITILQTPSFIIGEGISELYVFLYVTNLAGVENVLRLPPLFCEATPPVFDGTVTVLPNAITADYSTIMAVDVSTTTVCIYNTDVVSVLVQQNGEAECDRCVMFVRV